MEIPWPEDHEFIKMKILSAGEREDTNKGIQDLDDVKSLLKRKVVSMEYGDEEERAAITNSLNKSLLSYLERESEWSAAEWKAKLGLD